MPMPIARVSAFNTRAGRLIIGPTGRPLSSPIAVIVEITISLRGRMIISTAKTMQPPARIKFGRPVRPARKPPSGTDITANHSTMLITEPAADIDQPRSSSIEGPKLKIMANPTLKRPHIRPAAIRAANVVRSGHDDPAAAVVVIFGGDG